MKKLCKSLILLGLLAVMLAAFALPALAENPYDGGWSNCVWGAWQVTFEKTGIQLPAWGDAVTWFDMAPYDGFAVGTKPQAPCIVVMADQGGGPGHVAYVYKVAKKKLYIIEGGYNDTGKRHKGTMTYPKTNSFGANGKPQTIRGYIYLKDHMAAPAPEAPVVIQLTNAKQKQNVRVGKTYQIDLAGAQAVSFKSSKKKIAKVSATGLITPKKKGKCKITVTLADGTKRVLKLTIKKKKK